MTDPRTAFQRYIKSQRALISRVASDLNEALNIAEVEVAAELISNPHHLSEATPDDRAGLLAENRRLSEALTALRVRIEREIEQAKAAHNLALAAVQFRPSVQPLFRKEHLSAEVGICQGEAD